VLDAEEVVAEPSLPQALDFEAIDFDISAEEIEIGSPKETPTLSTKTQPKTKPAETIAETDFDIEESDADIISKYLSEAEEKAKKKPDPAKDSNVIEFDWDLPKVDKD